MTPQRLIAWRRRLGLSSVMDKRLARMIRLIQREEREACVRLVEAVPCVNHDEASVKRWIVDALKKRKAD